MVTRRINNHDFVFYDTIEDLPIAQFHRYSKFVLVDGGVGDSIQDIDRHITKIINYLSDTRKAYQELMNLRQCLFLVASEQDVHHKATLCLVKSVDGEDWLDFSDNGLEKLYEIANGVKMSEFEVLAKSLRDNIDNNLRLYFPNMFNDSNNKNYSDLLRKRALLQVGKIMGEDNDEKIMAITSRMYSMQKPRVFEGSDGEEVAFDKQFEDMCLVIAREFGGEVKKYTTMEFYSAFERLTKENKEMQKLRKHKK